MIAHSTRRTSRNTKADPVVSTSRKRQAKVTLRGRRFPAEPLTQDEVEALLLVCSKWAPTEIRNKSLIVVFWRGGLRVKEALALLPKDFDVEHGTLRVLHGKGDRARLIGIDPEAASVLQRWLDNRSSVGLNGRQPLFCTLNGGPLATVYVWNSIKLLARKAGIEKRVHLHGLRHVD